MWVTWCFLCQLFIYHYINPCYYFIYRTSNITYMSKYPDIYCAICNGNENCKYSFVIRSFYQSNSWNDFSSTNYNLKKLIDQSFSTMLYFLKTDIMFCIFCKFDLGSCLMQSLILKQYFIMNQTILDKHYFLKEMHFN